MENLENESENINLMIDELYNNVNVVYPNEIENIDHETDSNKDLDTSWINDTERLFSIQETYQREPMDHINLYFIYINRNLYIEKIINDKYPLTLSDDKKYSYLTKEQLLQIVQSKKIKTQFSKYKFLDILSYLVDLDPEHIQSYSKNENLEQEVSPFFKSLPITNDIKIPSSIFIFHEINAIYFLFQEIELLNHRSTLKSILKSVIPEISNKTNTKKVRIQTGSIETSMKNKNKSKSGRSTRKKEVS